MTIQGMNITISIYRPTTSAKDSIGDPGTVTETLIDSGVKARISTLKPTEELILQGWKVDKMFNCSLQPVTTDVLEGDIVVPESGSFMNYRMHVMGVKVDSLTPSDPRAHKTISLQREEKAEITQ